MSKKVKIIIAGAVVILLLVGGLVALLLLPQNEGPAESNILSTETITLLEENPDELVSLTVTNESGGYAVKRTNEQTWEIPELEGLAQLPSMFTQVKEKASSLVANSLVSENCENLTQYGLDKPTAEIVAEFANGTIHRISLGAKSPDGIYRYGLLTGEKNVYALSGASMESFDLSKFDFLEKSVIPAYAGEATENSVPEIGALQIERLDMEKPILIEKTPEDTDLLTTDPLTMASPVSAMLHSVRTNAVIFGCFGLTADRIAAVNPTAEELARFGLDNPSGKLSMTYGEKDEFSSTVLAGRGLDADGKELADTSKTPAFYYVMQEGGKIVYVAAAAGMPWMTVQPKDLISPLLTLPHIADVSSVDVTIGGVKHELVLTVRETESSSSTGTNDKPTDFDVALDGKAVVEAEAKHFYQLLLSSSIQDVNTAGVSKAPDLAIQFNLRSGKKESIDFYVLEDLTTIVAYNGEANYVGRSGYVDKVAKELQNLADGKVVGTDW